MLETRPDHAALKWRRTAFVRIDGSMEAVHDDWSLSVGYLPSARIYRVRGGPHDGRWFWAVQIGPDGAPFNSGTGYAADGRGAREVREAILGAIEGH